MWNVLENGYLDPHAMTRIDFSKERGRVSYNQFPLLLYYLVSMRILWENCFPIVVIKKRERDYSSNQCGATTQRAIMHKKCHI